LHFAVIARSVSDEAIPLFGPKKEIASGANNRAIAMTEEAPHPECLL